ncbi:MAG: glycosyltransferase [Candidatus Paceibacterota bacterium]|jgi:glycosyltransferase involved in cell wall biosynthesis
MKTVVFFGIYDGEYSRNSVLMQGFQDNGWNVLECSVDPRKYRGWTKYSMLRKKWKELAVKPDILFVATPGQSIAWLAKFLFPRGLIIFDAFTSLYDTNVFDRKRYGRWSLGAMHDFLLDWYSVRVAKYVTVDTAENAQYFHKTFGILSGRIIPVFVGSNAKLSVTKSTNRTGKFIVHFHGTYIPLHGIEYIIRAAKLIETEKGISFRIIGRGQEYEKMMIVQEELKPENVEYFPQMPFGDLVNMMAEADVVLGIFGITDKAGRVIPNKVFEGMSLGKAIITENSPAIRELLTDNENVIFAMPGYDKSLAEKILLLKKNTELREKIGRNAKDLFEKELQPKDLVSKLLLKLNI